MLKSILLTYFFLSTPLLIKVKTFNNNFYCVRQGNAEWVLSDLVSGDDKKIRIFGNPAVIACKYGKALVFNGVSDGLFLDSIPLIGKEQFTIEAIVRPDSGGNSEQRFFHCGEIRGDRVLMETRSTKTSWYFDAFIKSSNQEKVMVAPNLMHPLNHWYHIAFVVDQGKLVTYVNGEKELEDKIKFVPINGGKTSIGVRLNEQSWFKGAIYKIRISSQALNPDRFMDY